MVEEQDTMRASIMARLQEAEDVLRAIREGEIDALAVNGKTGPRIHMLSGSEHPYRILVESMNEGAVTLSIDGRILYANPAFCRLLQKPAEEILNGNFKSCVQTDDQLIFSTLLGKAREAGSKGEVRLFIDGTQLPVLVSLSPLVEFEGPECVCAVVTDLREQKRHQEHQAASQAKDIFLATLSHELRTPLSAILGWVGLLRESKTPQMVEKAAEVIERNARAQTTLINDILDMSRIISGKAALEMRTVNVVPIVKSALESVRLAAEAKGIHLRESVSDETAYVLGDAERLQQIVFNLLSNAIKFTPRDGLVEAAIEIGKPNLTIAIKDSGQGIGPDFLPFVFDPFRQADGSSTRRHGGLGLGLAIVRNLAELHGGTVHAMSAGKGQGSVFTVELPCAPPPASATSGGTEKDDFSKEEFPGEPLRGTQILVVDDQPDTLMFLSLSLKRHGARVLTASSAQQALEILLRDSPDVLISDIAMPEDDGYSLISKLRAVEAERHAASPIPAIALTAFARREDAEGALLAGFARHIAKPVDVKELVEAVRTLAEARRV